MTDDMQKDRACDETPKGYFRPALEQVLETGRDLRSFAEFAAKKFGDTVTPFMREFLEDLREGRVDVRGLSGSAKTMLFGHRVDTAQRAEMIRTAAYFRAERRGFAEGHAEEDWIAAEREIDERLAQESGLVQKSYQTLGSAAVVAEKELTQLRSAVADWLGRHSPTGSS